MDTHLKVFIYLILSIVTQSCIPPKTIQKENISLKRSPELKKASQQDIAEVEIIMKEVSPKKKKVGANFETARKSQFASDSDTDRDASTKFSEQRHNENKETGKRLNSMPLQKKINTLPTLPKPPRAQQTTASSKAKNGVKNTNQRYKAETSGSNLHISQTHDNPHEEKAQLSEYGKKSAYAQGFQPKQNDSKYKKEDDIISKQLKDAASREKDPNLRKKLWYEYERYNSNL